MKYQTKASILKPMLGLAAKLGRRVTAQEIIDATGLSHDVVRAAARGEGTAYAQRTIDTLLTYFNEQGVPTMPNDLYVVLVDGAPLPPPAPAEPAVVSAPPPTPAVPRKPKLIKRPSRTEYNRRYYQEKKAAAKALVPDLAT
jgi:hypothetical protein